MFSSPRRLEPGGSARGGRHPARPRGTYAAGVRAGDRDRGTQRAPPRCRASRAGDSRPLARAGRRVRCSCRTCAGMTARDRLGLNGSAAAAPIGSNAGWWPRSIRPRGGGCGGGGPARPQRARAAAPLRGDAARLAARFALRTAPRQRAAVRLGRRSTVQLPSHPGRGGRNQHLALAARASLRTRGPDAASGRDRRRRRVTEDARRPDRRRTCARLRSRSLTPTAACNRRTPRAARRECDLVHTGRPEPMSGTGD